MVPEAQRLALSPFLKRFLSFSSPTAKEGIPVHTSVHPWPYFLFLIFFFGHSLLPQKAALAGSGL